MSKSDEQNTPDPEQTDETLAPDSGEASAADDGATMPAPDDTASLAAPDDGATYVENTMAPDETPVDEASGDEAAEVPPDGATMRLEDAPAPEELDETATMAAAAEPAAPADADATIGDEQLMRVPSAAEAQDDGATIAQDDEQPLNADQTIADPGLAGGAPTSINEDDGATQALPDAAGPAGADQTMVDDSMDQSGADGAATEATMMESAEDHNPDATQIEHSTGATTDDHTVMESEFHSATGGGSAHDGTQVLDDSAGPSRASRGPKRPKGKGAHETADRWEYEQRYQLVTNFARGGLGQIWMANDTRLRREVAYKELLPNALKSKNSVERFLEEAQITGQLEHPGIVPIYDIGYQQNGTPFYAMKLVRGDTMEKAIELFHQLPQDSPEWAITRRKLLGNFVDVCNAIAFAHDRGVLHRDLKPLNVMLGAFGETLVLDWGLAKVLEDEAEAAASDGTQITADPGAFSVDGETVMEDSAAPTTGATGASAAATTGDQTQVLDSKDGSASAAAGVTAAAAHAASAAAGGQSQVSFGGTKTHVRTDVRTAGSQTMMGSIMGTPAYMPPEQAKGKLDEIDPRADIYSLGGILYKLLTNRQPIQKGKNIKELLKRVIDGEIIPPRQHEASIDKPLEAICLKALATKRKDRYQSALDIVKDVEAFLADEPVSCFEDPPLVKARRWVKKNQRTVVGVSTTVAAVLVFWIGSSIVHASTLSGIRSFAAEQLKAAEESADKGEFETAATALNEAIGRAGSEPDLAELKSSLENQLALFEQTRLQKLESESARRIQVARSDFRGGQFGKARTSLAETLVMIGDEESLAGIRTEADTLLTRIETAIAQQSEIEATQKKFEQFRALADEARARGSMPGAANEREDAQIALATAVKALKLFGLDQAQAFEKPPAWFDEDLPWVIEFQLRTGKLPLAALKNDAFELMILLADLELFLAKDGPANQLQAAAKRGLGWVNLAKETGAVSPVPYIWEEICHRRLGDNDAAEKALVEARKIQPATALDFFLLGEADRKSGRYENALVQYLKVVRIDGGHYWTQHCMGLCYLKLEVYHAAVSAFSNAASLRENYAWPIMLRGVAHGQLNLFEESLADFEAAIAIDETLFNVYINRGFLFIQKTGQHAKALADFQKAAELASESPLPHINIAAWYVDEARRIREGDGEFEETPDLERVALEATALDKALAALDAAEKVGNAAKNPGIVALRAKIAMQQGNMAVALDLFAKHAQLAPTRADVASSQKRIGFLQFRLGEFDLAIAAFQKADQAVPEDPETIYMLGECFLQKREVQPALKYFLAFDALAHKKLRSEINRPEALYTGIATALNMLGRKDEAISYYTLALKNTPGLAAAMTKRGWAYAVDGLRLAKADFEKAVETNGADADARIGLGFTLAKLGDWKNGETQLALGVDQAKKQIQNAIDRKEEETVKRGWILFFNAATGLAQAYNVSRGDGSIPTEERRVVATRLYSATIARLEESLTSAKSTGQLPFLIASLERDVELKPVRGLSGFQDVLTRAKAALKAASASGAD